MSYRLWQCHCVADSNSVSADAGFNSVNVLEALTVSTRSWAWVCPGSSWKAMYKVVKKFTVSSNNLVHSVVVFVIVDFICLIVLKVRHKVSLSPGHTSQHAPGFHIPACTNDSHPSMHQGKHIKRESIFNKFLPNLTWEPNSVSSYCGGFPRWMWGD